MAASSTPSIELRTLTDRDLAATERQEGALRELIGGSSTHLSLCGCTQLTTLLFNRIIASCREELKELDLRDCPNLKRIVFLQDGAEQPIVFPALHQLSIGGEYQIEALSFIAPNLKRLTIQGSFLPQVFKTQRNFNCEFELTDSTLLPTIMEKFQPSRLTFRDIHMIRDKDLCHFMKAYRFHQASQHFPHQYLYEDKYLCIHNDSEGRFPPHLDKATTLDLAILEILNYDVMQVRYGLEDNRRTAWIAKRELVKDKTNQ